MDTTLLSTSDWLEQELQFINHHMAHTLNGRLNEEPVSRADPKQ